MVSDNVSRMVPNNVVRMVWDYIIIIVSDNIILTVRGFTKKVTNDHRSSPKDHRGSRSHGGGGGEAQ